MTQTATKVFSDFKVFLKTQYHKAPAEAAPVELHAALSQALMSHIADDWDDSQRRHASQRRALYFSAEFLVGRAIYNNLLCLGLTEEIGHLLEAQGASLDALEEIEDAALGNGGLGRLAACYLDSGATLNLPLDGYGIRYRYGLFKQTIESGFQKEQADDWTAHGDPWSLRRDDLSVEVAFGDQTVRAVPYDMPILGYGTTHVSTLRLWQSESLVPFDFVRFNNQEYDAAVAEKNRAEDISRVLYPNDSTDDGKVLRLKQEYFFSSASLQDMLRAYEATHGNDYSDFAALHTIQLNDTHPVLAIPELIRLLMARGLTFDAAFGIAREVFCYTNHTIMAEALETWDRALLERALPGMFDIIERIDAVLADELAAKNVDAQQAARMAIVHRWDEETDDEDAPVRNRTVVRMAFLACFAGRYVNGVAQLHTEILKNDVLHDWYTVWPERFQNKTNGITQRRWLALCNPKLAALLTRLLGDDGWLTDLSRLEALDHYAEDENVLRDFVALKGDCRHALANYVKKLHGIALDPNTILDVQIKRLHEYKRQLLNILTILELYFEIKEGTLRDFAPTTFLFAAKSAPGYARAKGIIKLIGAVSDLIAADPVVSRVLKVQFVPNYNVSLAEHIIAAADISEQISTAGTEASGTGNMKLMANGAVTLGTLDGANVEILAEAGAANEYIFGAHVEEIRDRAAAYDPNALYQSDARIRRVLDALIDGTLDDGDTGMFRELYDSILKGASWHKPDQYYLLLDFGRFLDAKIQVNRDAANRLTFAKKAWHNICHCGKFSSDRAIREYAHDIWCINPVQ